MSGLHRELGFYLRRELPSSKVNNVLIVGRESEKIAAVFPPGYFVLAVEEIESLTDQYRIFDGILLNNLFNDAPYQKVKDFMRQILLYLKPRGRLAVREFLQNSVWNLSRLTGYLDGFNQPDETSGGQQNVGCRLLWETSVQSTVQGTHDWRDHYWMFEKTQFQPVADGADNSPASPRDYLDRYQYTEHGIKKYEWIFGRGFISPGGARRNMEFLERLNLEPGQSVLDIGCGIGGCEYQLAKNFGCHSLGLDLSSNVISIACERATLNRDSRIRFMVADAINIKLEERFDLIYSRDCILHINDKATLFKNISTWLKPGGKLFITDYMKNDQQTQSEAFREYVASRQYTLWSVGRYVQEAKSVGLVSTKGTDLTDNFRYLINAELETAKEHRQDFLQNFSQQEYDYLLEGWRAKLGYIDYGDMKWGSLYAEKPAN